MQVGQGKSSTQTPAGGHRVAPAELQQLVGGLGLAHLSGELGAAAVTQAQQVAIDKASASFDKLYGTGALDAAPIPSVALAANDLPKVEAFLGAMDAVVDGASQSVSDTSVPEIQAASSSMELADIQAALGRVLNGMGEFNDEALLIEFLKLNVENPANDVKTQNDIYELASKATKDALETAKTRMKEAEEKLQKARRKQKRAGIFKIVALVVAVIATIVSLGSAAATLGIALVAMKSVLSTVALAVGLVSAGVGVASATANYKAAKASLAAQTSENLAKRQEARADEQRDTIDEESRLIRMIMETKNQAVEAVLNMMRDSAATTERITALSLA